MIIEEKHKQFLIFLGYVFCILAIMFMSAWFITTTAETSIKAHNAYEACQSKYGLNSWAQEVSSDVWACYTNFCTPSQISHGRVTPEFCIIVKVGD